MEFNYYTIILGFFIGLILFSATPKLKKQDGGEPVPSIKISVVIPARNEEQNLPNILSDLKNQTYELHEIICVDDDSKDRTPQIIKSFGVRSVELDSLPEGWNGKQWACQNGAKAATGDVLLFIDSDVRLSETAVHSLVSRYTKEGKPLSVQPFHIVKKQHEYFSLFFNMIQICATGLSISTMKRKMGFYGPLLMIPKEMFQKHGGYQVVKNNVVEDFNLGRYYNKQGIDLDLLMGAKEVRFRMYQNSFHQVFEGWTKNFSKGSISLRWWLVLLITVWISALTAVPIELVKGIGGRNWVALLVLGAVYLFFAGSLYRTLRCIGSYPAYVCVVYPIYLAAFHAIFFYSIIATFVTKSTTWKDRKL